MGFFLMDFFLIYLHLISFLLYGSISNAEKGARFACGLIRFFQFSKSRTQDEDK